MNDQLKLILIKARLNFAVLAAILVLAILGKFTNPEFTNTIFATTDQLVSNLYLVFIAITLDAFIGLAILIQMGIFSYLTIDYLFAVLLVILGFTSIANLYRRYQFQ